MTDLSDFGGGLDRESYNREHYEEDDDDSGSSNPEYRTGRCRGITVQGDRCSGSVAGSNIGDDDPDLCHMHGNATSVYTIDDTPMSLIEATSRTPWDRLDERDVDHRRIRQAVHLIHGLEDMPIKVTDNEVILPYRYARTSKMVIRAPTTTVKMTTQGKGWDVERLECPVVDRDNWDRAYLGGEEQSREIRNPECLPEKGEVDGFSIGLKIFGDEQEWYPVVLTSRE